MRIAVAIAVATLACAQARAEHPESSAERAERLRQAEVVVVSGSADHMDQVLRHAQIKFVVVSPDELPGLPLHGQQVLMVNCTGEMSKAARERVRRFVTAGGFLYTTDHAVHNLIENTFPGFIRFTGKTSTEEIFPMQAASKDERGLLKHLGGSQGHPRWQLAGGGYLFEIVDHQRVETLMSSNEVGARYGRANQALGVRFHVGDGQVIHVTGHFFTQPGQRPEVAAAGQAFEQLSANVVAEKRADRDRLGALYDVSPKRAAPMQDAPAPTAAPIGSAGGKSVSTSATTKLRVLDRKGDYAHVRDTEGNEGYVPANSL